MSVDKSQRIFVYKLTTDNGGAPCVANRLLSLCICKPDIRKSAEAKDWIVGFGGVSVPELKGRLIYLAQVDKVLSEGMYYKCSKYKTRPDCIYQWNEKDGRFEIKSNAQYHKGGVQLEDDLGKHGSYEKSYSLLSRDFVYLGNRPVAEYKRSFKTIESIYRGLPRNYTFNHDTKTREALAQFIDEIVSHFGYGKHGKPTHEDRTKKCNVDEDGLLECSAATVKH